MMICDGCQQEIRGDYCLVSVRGFSLDSPSSFCHPCAKRVYDEFKGSFAEFVKSLKVKLKQTKLSDKFLSIFSKFKKLNIYKIKVDQEQGCEIQFIIGPVLRIYDDRQISQENRWMSCEDDLRKHKGACLTGVEMAESAAGDREELGLLRIHTTAGNFTLCVHNHHSGSPSGFNPCGMLDAPGLH